MRKSAKAPDKAELVKLVFEKGIPVQLNGEHLSLAKLTMKLNKLAGQHGVGVAHMVEDRLVGVKNGGVYEQPAAHVTIEAHKALEKYVCTRVLREVLRLSPWNRNMGYSIHPLTKPGATSLMSTPALVLLRSTVYK